MITRKHIFIALMLLSVVLLTSAGFVTAQTQSHNFRIDESLNGFSARNAEITYETGIDKEGGTPGSIRITIAEGRTYANLTMRASSTDNPHRDWLSNWSPYERISAWVYFEELDSMPENKGVAVRLGGNKSTQVLISKSELTLGWNYIEANLLTLLGGQDNQLANMDSLSVEIIVDKTGMYIVDEIQLHATESVTTREPVQEPVEEPVQAISTLLTELQNTNFLVSNNASNKLVEMGESAIPSLVSLLKTSKEPWDRVKALNVLVRMDVPEAIPAIFVAISDPDLIVQDTLSKNLLRLYNEKKVDLVPLLRDYLVAPDYRTRITTVAILASLGVNNKQLAEMYIYLIEEYDDEPTKLIGLEGLAKLGADASTVANRLLNSLDREDRLDVKLTTLNTIASIGGTAGEQIYTTLTEMLLSQNWAERQDGIWLLRRLGLSGDELVALAKQSWKGMEDQARLHIVDVLGHLALTQKESSFALMDILADDAESRVVRQATYKTLKSLVPQLEYHLERGLVAVSVPEGVYISWRLLGIEDYSTPFNLYRDGVKVNSEPIALSTNYLDHDGTIDSTYTVRALVNGVEQSDSEIADVWNEAYLPIPLQQVPGDVEWKYTVSDVSIGDLDGDGEYELVVRRHPPLYEDKYVAADQYIVFEAYEFDGTFMWRIDMGPNTNEVNSLQFLVYDLDGDGRAEMITRTADGSMDGQGNIIGKAVDYRPLTPYYIVKGRAEYISVFDGVTGVEIARADDIAMDNPSKWGDSRGHRAHSRRMAIAYLDGKQPSVITSRGVYDLIDIAAFDFIDGKLIERWYFTSADWPGYSGQGNHSLSVADVNGDGKDVITYGAMAINSDGTGLYTTGIGHGDALHVGDFLLDRPGLEAFDVAETPSPAGIQVRDARTGEIIWGIPTDYDVGGGLTADIDPNYPGNEFWAARSPLYSSTGDVISKSYPSSMKFAAWWDGDLLRELVPNHANRVDKWDYENNTTINLFIAKGSAAQLTALQADICGDWREELIWPSANHKELRVYTTTYLTDHRLYTLMHDRMYRTAIAWQNVGYKHPPHPSYYVGTDMEVQDFSWGLVKSALDEFSSFGHE